MGKLLPQTPEILSEYKKTLRKNHPEIIGIQEFFRDYVGTILKNDTFSKNDFNYFERYLELIKQYHDILLEAGLNVSIKKTECFILGQNLDEFREFIKNIRIIDLIKDGKAANISFLFGENFFNIKNKDDLLELTKHEKWDGILYLIKYSEPENIKLIFGENFFNIKNKDDLEYLFNYGLYPYLFIDFTQSKAKLKRILEAFKKNFRKNIIGDNFDLLFPVKSYRSKVFKEIKHCMQLESDKDIYCILREKINTFLNTLNIEKQDSGELELAIYLRYSHTVDYPEIGELLIIFIQESIKRGLIKGVKGIKIIPREKLFLPRDAILDENSRFCNVNGEDFIKELNMNSIPFYLSYSKNEAKGLAIASGAMIKKEGQINLGLELENEHDFLKTFQKSMQEIFEILTRVIGEINTII